MNKIIQNHRSLTERILFDNYMISSIYEDDVHTVFPIYLNEDSYKLMVNSAITLNNLVLRIIKEPSNLKPSNFPFMDEIMQMNSSLEDFFWVRYDAFERAQGGIFFSEFNYDKPCAQRETLICENFSPLSNPSYKFNENFVNNFIKSISNLSGPITVGILVSPDSYEELHLAHLYMDMLKNVQAEFIIVSPENLYVKQNRVMAFNKHINVILRQFPTERLHEIKDFSCMLKLVEEKKLLIINDVRAILGQSKSLFAFLWDCYLNDKLNLTSKEKFAIKNTIPYTILFNEKHVNMLIENKDKYVVKASYGRYSKEVYIGCLYTEAAWKELILSLCTSTKEHIIQEFCKIKKDRSIRFLGHKYVEEQCYCNYGIYLSNSQYIGISSRLSNSYLTTDTSVWIAPVCIHKSMFRIDNFQGNYNKVWEDINEKAAFNHNYCGGYINTTKAFLLDALILQRETYEELTSATEFLCKIFKKTRNFVLSQGSLLLNLLGINPLLHELILKKTCASLTFLGRLDWVITESGELKLLEFNAETPAGIIESTAINDLIHKRLYSNYLNPCENLMLSIRSSFMNICKSLNVSKIGFVSTSFTEDWYNTEFLYESLKDLPLELYLGHINNINCDFSLSNYNSSTFERESLDAIYRYYPLDWIGEESFFAPLLKSLNEKAYSINPPHSLICQSKAFFALIHQCLKLQMYTVHEAKIIEKYIPLTSFNEADFVNGDYCIKPLLGREGEDIAFSYSDPEKPQGKYVLQERIGIKKTNVNLQDAFGVKEEVLYPIIGTFVTDTNYAGIYTRLGNSITNAKAYYIPTYIE